ncbi:MAG: cell envelope biogenesis protein TolA, partial [Alphaproteobacteria bacterium]|nr:cell envelope biogenesis protein TolA [Alphaproteobacteria bacterium]
MARNFILSILFHAIVVAVAYFGLPSFRDSVILEPLPLSVELVTVADVTNLPTKPKEPEPTP